MKFVVTHNGQEIQAFSDSPNQTLMFMVVYKREGGHARCKVSLNATDLDSQTTMKWIDREILSDDSFTIATLPAEETGASTPSAISEIIDRKASMQKNKLEMYHKLQQELVEKGLL